MTNESAVATRSNVSLTPNAPLTDGEIDRRLVGLASAVDDASQWAEVAPDFGAEVTFDAVGQTFIGLLVSRKIVPLPDLNDASKMRDAMVYEFMDLNRERRSIWGSWSLDFKLTGANINQPIVNDGSIVKIEYRGEDDFKADTGEPRRVKRYKVSVLPVIA